MLEFPQIDPVAFDIAGIFIVRWYALAYLAGIGLGWWVLRRLVKGPFKHHNISSDKVDDFITWAIVGIILGGRLGYVFFYNAGYYLDNPDEILAIWQGGMSFHGGALGVILAIFLFSWRHKIKPVAFADPICAVVPIGLFFGRIANFINGELVGRPTTSDYPLSMVFPHIDALPRHPSQLYEAATEGLILFIILQYLSWYTKAPEKLGFVSGAFLAGYGVFRFLVEFTRMPDLQVGFLAFGMTMGQILCIPMIIIGLALMLWPHLKKA